MAETIREIFKRKLVPVGFVRTMGLLGATTLGIGALMGAGIYVLIGLAAGSAGPAVWLSYLVCGLLGLLSVAVFGELSRRVPVSGGGYAFVYSALGSLWGFMTGWLLALGSIFACAMYATGFAYYATTLFSKNIPEPLLKATALGAIVFLTMLNSRGTKSGDGVQKLLTWGNLLVLAILIGLAVPKADPKLMVPMFPKGLGGLGGAIAIIYVSFFGYQLIANNARVEIVAWNEPCKLFDLIHDVGIKGEIFSNPDEDTFLGLVEPMDLYDIVEILDVMPEDVLHTHRDMPLSRPAFLVNQPTDLPREAVNGNVFGIQIVRHTGSGGRQRLFRRLGNRPDLCPA